MNQAGGDRASVEARVHRYLRRRGIDPARTRVARLAGDASDRCYFRITGAGGDSWILAAHPAPFDPDTLPQLVVGPVLERVGIPIPRVLDRAGDLGLLALEDLGDRTLQHWLADADHDPAPPYREAIRMIARLQDAAPVSDAPATVPFTLAFDVPKLRQELDFFRTEFLGAHRGAAIDGVRGAALAAELQALAEALAAEPRVLCHRDFHARNLMVSPRGLVVIDFQDARMGPATYDLVSLLRDCYVELPSGLIETLVEQFLALVPAQRTDDFQTRLDLMSVQRHLKALGTFGHQVSVAGRPDFAEPIPRTLGYLRPVLHRTPRCSRLLELLAAAVPELA